MRLIDADELKKRAEEICFPDMPVESDFKCWDAVTREFVNWRWIPYGYTCITLESVTHWMPLPNPPEVTP